MKPFILLCLICLSLGSCRKESFEDCCMASKISEFKKGKTGNLGAAIYQLDTSLDSLYGFQLGQSMHEDIHLYTRDCDFVCSVGTAWSANLPADCPEGLEVFGFTVVWTGAE